MGIDILAAVAVFAALTLLGSAILSRQTTESVDERVRSLTGGRLRRTEIGRMSFAQRFFDPIIGTALRGVIALMPTTWLAWADRRLTTAGRPLSVSTYFGLILVLGTSLPAGYFVLLWAGTDGHPSARGLLLVPVLLGLGVILPVMWLRRVARRRQNLIWRSLPDSFDLITTCVEAGLSLDGAFQKVAEKFKGPLGDEVGQMLAEVALGKTRREALTDMAARIDVVDFTVFATAVIQSEQLGTSLAQVLRVQAAQIRMRRRQRAEQVARQAPVKMAFPLVLCLMPAFFIFVIGPVFIRLVHFLNS